MSNARKMAKKRIVEGCVVESEWLQIEVVQLQRFSRRTELSGRLVFLEIQ